MAEISQSNIDQRGVNHLKNLARQLKKSSGMKMSEALFQIAKQHGFLNWNNVLRFASLNSTCSIPSVSSNKRRTSMFLSLKENAGIIAGHHEKTNRFYDGWVYRELESPVLINLFEVRSITFFEAEIVVEKRIDELSAVLSQKWNEDEGETPNWHKLIVRVRSTYGNEAFWPYQMNNNDWDDRGMKLLDQFHREDEFFNESRKHKIIELSYAPKLNNNVNLGVRRLGFSKKGEGEYHKIMRILEANQLK